MYTTVRETCAEIPDSFVRRLAADLDNRLPEAGEYVRQNCAEVHISHFYGQAKYFYSEDVFQRTAGKCGIRCDARPTRSPGGAYHIAKFSNIDLGVCSMQKCRFLPKREAKYQVELAAQNTYINPPLLNFLKDKDTYNCMRRFDKIDPQYNLFEELDSVKGNRLYMMVIVRYDLDSSEEQKFLGFGIPNSDLSGWIDLMSFDEFLGCTGSVSETQKPILEIEDRATPTLKSKPRRSRDQE